MFRTLRLRCFGPADRNLQGVAVFGSFFADTQDAGNPADRQMSAVPIGRDTLIALSLRSFKTFLFCPNVATALAPQLLGLPPNTKVPANIPLPINKLPSTCGSAASIVVSETTVTSIDAGFGQDRVEMSVGFNKSGPCFTASGVIVSYIHFSVTEPESDYGPDYGKLVEPTITSKTEQVIPNVDVEVNFWCALAGMYLFGPFDALVIQAVRDAMAGVAGGLASNAVAAMNPPPSESPVAGISLRDVIVTPDEFSVVGDINTPKSWPEVPDLTLNLVESIPIRFHAIPGIWNTQIFCKNEAKDYSYTEFIQTQSQKYRVEATLIALPLSVVYSVRRGVGDPWLKLDPSASSVTVTGVECLFPTPLSSGGSRIRRDVTLLYAINGNEISVSSQDGQGNFGFELRAEVSDASGGLPPGVDPAPVGGRVVQL